MEQQDDISVISNDVTREFGDDVLMGIFSRLPLKLLFRCKCVCKAWQGLISDEYITESKLQKSLSGLYCGANWMLEDYIFICDTPNKLSADFAKDVLSLNFLPCYPNFKIHDSSNGLLVCSHTERTLTACYVCNPLTKTWATLPNPPVGCDPRDYGVRTQLEFDPRISSVYKVILVEPIKDRLNKYYKLAIFQSDIGEWVEHKLLASIGDDDISSVVVMDGTLYAIQRGCLSHFLVRICIKEEKHQSIPLPVERPFSEMLIKFQSVLYYISYSVLILQIWELSEASNMEWDLKHKGNAAGAPGYASLVAFHPDQGVVFLHDEVINLVYHLENSKVEGLCSFILGHPDLCKCYPFLFVDRPGVHAYTPCMNLLPESSMS